MGSPMFYLATPHERHFIFTILNVYQFMSFMCVHYCFKYLSQEVSINAFYSDNHKAWFMY